MATDAGTRHRMLVKSLVPQCQSRAISYPTAVLMRGCFEPMTLHASAAANRDDGVEESLTLHRLGLFKELGQVVRDD